jgi:hypothetical protein
LSHRFLYRHAGILYDIIYDISRNKNDINAIRVKVDKLDANRVAKLAYTQYAFDADVIDGVDNFDIAAEQNVPTEAHTDYNPTILNKGIRTEGASLPRQAFNHFIGRLSYNVNKVIQKLKLYMTATQALWAHNSAEYDSTAAYAPGDICFDFDDVGRCCWYKRISQTPETIMDIAPTVTLHWTPVPLTAVSPAVDNNSTSVPTTAWELGQIINNLITTSTTRALSAAMGKKLQDEKAPLASPVLTGTPKIPNKTSAATSSGILIASEAQVALKADIGSPVFTGTPKIGNNPVAVVASTSDPDNVNLPVGATVICLGWLSEATFARNTAQTLRLGPDSITYSFGSYTSNAVLSGVWRACSAGGMSYSSVPWDTTSVMFRRVS